ncbi:MAG: ATP-binding protein [Bacillus sp. (in: firmicutes)]
MKMKVNLKQKSFLIVAISILLTIFITYNILNIVYLNSHEKYTKIHISKLLEQIENDYENAEYWIDWTWRNLNLNIHVFDNIDELFASFPAEADPQRIIPTPDMQLLEAGIPISNKIKAKESNLNMLLFVHPVVKNEHVDSFLMLHLPINNAKGEESAQSIITILMCLAAGVCIFIVSSKAANKSYRQLYEIKQAAVEVSKGNFDAKVWKSSSDELGEMADVFNEMSNALKEDKKRVKAFVEDLSHELKAPLTLVKSYNRALMDGLVHNADEQKKYYALIDRETDRLQRLLQNCLDFSKLDADTVELELHPLVFAQSIEDIMAKYELLFTEKKIDLRMSLDYEVIVLADEDRLEQIIQNLIQNAVRYSKEDASIFINMERQANDICLLSITDNGIGISEEHLSLITNRFFRVNKVRSRKESGTGLGLSIVEKLMELHGGKLGIESQLGVGTTIKLTFPCHQQNNCSS